MAYSQLKKTLGKNEFRTITKKTDIKLSVKQTFGFESDMQVGAFSKKNEYVPKIDLIISLTKKLLWPSWQAFHLIKEF